MIHQPDVIIAFQINANYNSTVMLQSSSKGKTAATIIIIIIMSNICVFLIYRKLWLLSACYLLSAYFLPVLEHGLLSACAK